MNVNKPANALLYGLFYFFLCSCQRRQDTIEHQEPHWDTLIREVGVSWEFKKEKKKREKKKFYLSLGLKDTGPSVHCVG